MWRSCRPKPAQKTQFAPRDCIRPTSGLPQPVPTAPVLIWFRQDLRLQDNAALASALARGGPVIPVYIHDVAGEGRWAPGGAARWWLHHSLAALDASLRKRNSRLVLARGDSATILPDLCRSTGAAAVYWNDRYEPAARNRDQAVAAALAANGLSVHTSDGTLLFEPAAITNRQGGPFQVYTPFWRHCLTLPVPAPVRIPAGPFPVPDRWPDTRELAALGLRSPLGWDAGFDAVWTPGEDGAQARLKSFFARSADTYDEQRNQPGIEGTSRLSPHLHFGEISPRQVWAAAQARAKASGVFPSSRGIQVFLSEIGWREFAHHLLHHFPHTPEQPLRPVFARFPWAQDPGGKGLLAWQRGRTGYPIVDAGMRQLWHTGWMHNRVRMITASFLVKHLRLPWAEGAAWFWDTLVDADLANNTLGWQWSAGCGADAAPYFRIFAPVLQGRKFDPDGTYIRRWVPELAQLPDRWIHEPWAATPAVLNTAGVALGRNYPAPIVDHTRARAQALVAFRSLRSG